MKKLLTILMISLSLAAVAQKKDTICQRLYSIKRVNSSFYLLNLGGRYPDQKYTAVLKGMQDGNELAGLIDSMICITGTLQYYHGKPQLVILGRLNLVKK